MFQFVMVILGDFWQRFYLLDSLPLDGGGRGWGCKGGAGHGRRSSPFPPPSQLPPARGKDQKREFHLKNALRFRLQVANCPSPAGGGLGSGVGTAQGGVGRGGGGA